MSERSSEIYTQNDMRIATALLASWGKEYPQQEVAKRVERAYATAFEADRMQSESQRLAVAYSIQDFIDEKRTQLVAEYGHLLSQIEQEVRLIIESKGEEGVSLLELQKKLAKIELKEGEVKDIDILVARFKAELLRVLKGTVIDKKSIEIQELLDQLNDKLRGKEPFSKVMREVLDLLCSKMGLKGAALSYTEPLVKKVEFGDDNFPADELSEERIVTTAGVSKNDIEFARQKAMEKIAGTERKSTPIGINTSEDQEIHYVTRVEIDGRDLGVLDFIIDSNEQLTSEFKTLTAQIESILDTLIDVGLQNLLERRLDQEVNRISVDTEVCELPNAIRRHLALLGSLIDAEIRFVYQPKLPEKAFAGYIIKDGQIYEIPKNDQMELLSSGDNIYTRPLEDKRKRLRPSVGRSPNKKIVGSISVVSHRKLTDGEIALIDIVTNVIQKDVLTRNEKLDSELEGQGSLIGQSAIEGKLEWRGYHPVAVTMIDVEGSTKFDEDLEEEFGKGRYSRMINKLYKRMKEIEKDPLTPSVFDKPEGDKVILITGAPFTIDGKDVFGESKPHPGKYVAIALHNGAKVKNIWKEILDEEESEYGKLPYRPKLCIGIEYSEKAEVGIFGMDEDDEESSRKDYTVLDKVSNVAARIQDQAKGGEILVSLAAWERMQDFLKENKLDPSIQKFVNTGLPVEVIGKGVANPIEVVKAVIKGTEDQKESAQLKLFIDKFDEVGHHGLAFKSIDELADGDYIIEAQSSNSGPQSLLYIEFECIRLGALLPKEKLPEIEYPVSIDIHKELLQREAKEGYSKRRILRIRQGRAVIVNYECIENIQTEKIADLLRESVENGKGIQINPELLPTGEYKIISHEKREGEQMYKLTRMSVTFKVLIPDSLIKGSAADSGVLVLSSRRFSCRSESPEWEELV